MKRKLLIINSEFAGIGYQCSLPSSSHVDSDVILHKVASY